MYQAHVTQPNTKTPPIKANFIKSRVVTVILEVTTKVE